MDNQRLFAWALFGLMLILTWQAWQQDYAAPPAPPAAATPVPEDALADTAPSLEPPPPGDDVPALEPAQDDVPLSEPVAAPMSSRLIDVETDVLHLRIDPNGGDIVYAELLRYPADACGLRRVPHRADDPRQGQRAESPRTFRRQRRCLSSARRSGSARRAADVAER